MNDRLHSMRNTDKQYFFEVQLNWLENNRGILYAPQVKGTLHIATASKFGGDGKEWSPEHLFLGSMVSCYMTTYLDFAQQTNVSISHFECSVIGQIEPVDARYKFTHINIYPKVYVPEGASRESAYLVFEKAGQYCIVTNSIDASIIYHTQVLKESLSLCDHSIKETGGAGDE